MMKNNSFDANQNSDVLTNMESLCVLKILFRNVGSGNGLSPFRRQIITYPQPPPPPPKKKKQKKN